MPNEISHTPGPWSIDRSSHFKTFQVVGPMFGNGGYAVAEMAYAGAQAEANAQLIAAAPELYDVALGMLDLIDRCGVKVNAEFNAALLRAIAKAEGKQ